jgi:hypothetical protein
MNRTIAKRHRISLIDRIVRSITKFFSFADASVRHDPEFVRRAGEISKNASYNSLELEKVYSLNLTSIKSKITEEEFEAKRDFHMECAMVKAKMFLDPEPSRGETYF